MTGDGTGEGGRAAAFGLLALVALFWAGNIVVGRAAAEEAPPMALAFWRFFLSALVLAPFGLRRAWERRDVIRREFRLLNLLALLSMTAFSAPVYLGLRYTEAVNGNLLQGALPLCILLSGVIFAGRGATLRQGAGMALGFAGLAAIVARGDVAVLLGLRLNVGDPLVLAGVFASATYAVFLFKRPAELGLAPFLFLMMLLGSLQTAPLYAAEHVFWARPLPLTEPALLAVGFVALFPSVLGQLFFAEGVRRVGAATAGHVIYLTPVFGVLMAVGVLGEEFRPFHAVGVLLIFAGIWLAVFGGRTSGA